VHWKGTLGITIHSLTALPDNVRFLSDGRLRDSKFREHFTFAWLLSADTLLACIVHHLLKGKRRAKITLALVPPTFSTQLLVHKTHRGVQHLTGALLISLPSINTMANHIPYCLIQLSSFKRFVVCKQASPTVTD